MPVVHCSICSGSFPGQVFLDRHLADAHNMGGPKQHRCNQCGYSCYDVLAMNQHKIKAHFQNKLQRPF